MEILHIRLKVEAKTLSNILLHSFNMFESRPDLLTSTQLTNNDPFIGGFTKQSPNYMNSGGLFKKADVVRSIISRISLDASMVEFRHTKTDPNTDKQESVKSSFIDRITFEANIDQSGRAFIYDVVYSMLDEGVIAVVPIDTSTDPTKTESFKIESIRVGKITDWYPRHIKVLCYNDRTGLEQSLVMPKDRVAIIESPLYSVLRDSNPTLELLRQKIKLMQTQDNNAATGKLQGFLQFPYQTNSSRRGQMAERRRKEIEAEMSSSKFGLATLEANEKFIPASGGLTNNLLEDVRKLQQDFYNEVGITENILNGTATPQEENRYQNRCIDPIVQALADGFNRAFLTKTARTQGHEFKVYRDPFNALPVEQLATTADLFTRNAILTPNEIRAFMGKPPHPSPLADQLFNRNIADANQNGGLMTPGQDDSFMDQGLDEDVPEIYDDGEGGFVDANGNPVDRNGNPLE